MSYSGIKISSDALDQHYDGYGDIMAIWKGFDEKAGRYLDSLTRDFHILFAYNSSKIENEKTTYQITREIFNNSETMGFGDNPGVIFEQQNQKLCGEFLEEKIAAKEPLSISLILKTHWMLTMLLRGFCEEQEVSIYDGYPGEFKRYKYNAHRYKLGSAPENVEEDLQKLLDEIEMVDRDDVLKAAAYFHANFLKIHPFADGNGRVGRTLLNYFLMINDYPPVVIHDEDKAEYYRALDIFEKSGQVEPLRIFIEEQTVKTWKNLKIS